MPDPKAVNSMFSRIAGRYDIANHLLSGGIDYQWRRTLVRSVRDLRPGSVLDLATGSGDVAFALAEGVGPQAQILGMDFCQPMLDQAVIKRSHFAAGRRVEFRWGDGLALPVEDNRFDVVTISFGLRNMENRHRALQEMRRVLRPGGCLYVLEFSQPYPWFRPIYFAYLKWLLPSVAALVTADRSAYEYLGGSIEAFPGRKEMCAEIVRAGFSSVEARALTFGIVALHRATK